MELRDLQLKSLAIVAKERIPSDPRRLGRTPVSDYIVCCGKDPSENEIASAFSSAAFLFINHNKDYVVFIVDASNEYNRYIELKGGETDA